MIVGGRPRCIHRGRVRLTAVGPCVVDAAGVARAGRVPGVWWDGARDHARGDRAGAARAAAVHGARRPGPAAAAAAGRRPAELPVARVAVDVALAHLDRPFDYLVPADLAEQAQPGVRVRVRFAGRLVDGFVLERAAEQRARRARWPSCARWSRRSRCSPRRSSRLARAVADRYAGTLADVLRLAVPPRHARVEAAAAAPTSAGAAAGPARARPAGPATTTAPPCSTRSHAGATVARGLDGAARPRLAGRGRPAGRHRRWPPAEAPWSCVPDPRDVARVDAALTGRARRRPARRPDRRARPGRALPALAARSAAARSRAVVGTRAAMFAPVRDLGLVVVWDDGDDLHAEPRAPYPHVREVLALRASRRGRRPRRRRPLPHGRGRRPGRDPAGPGRWPPAATRSGALAPRGAVAGDDADHAGDAGARGARLPDPRPGGPRARRCAHGPVLVQVPRRGYLPGLACATCRAPARCPACRGPLGSAGGGAAAAPAAGAGGPRPPGPARTATVTGSGPPRSGRGAPPRSSAGPSPGAGAHQRLGRRRCSPRSGPSRRWSWRRRAPSRSPRAATPRRCCSTAGRCSSGRTCARPRRRCAAGWPRPRWSGPARTAARVVVVADAATPAVQALVRWDPAGFADRELAERAALRLPPGGPDGLADRARPTRSRASWRPPSCRRRRGAGAGAPAGRRTRSGSWCARRARGWRGDRGRAQGGRRRPQRAQGEPARSGSGRPAGDRLSSATHDRPPPSSSTSAAC